MKTHAAILLVSLFVTGCGVEYRVISDQSRPRPLPPAPSPAPTPSPAPAIVLEQPPENVVPPAPVVAPTPQAGQLLLATAQQQSQSGDYSRAAATLERALRIAPSDPYLWHELALVRLAAGEWEQAIELANKSRTLSGSDQQLRRKNSEIIATASEHL